MVFRAEIIASARTPESRRTPSELDAAKGMAKSSPWKEAVALRKSATASPRPIPGAGIGAYGLSERNRPLDRRASGPASRFRFSRAPPIWHSPYLWENVGPETAIPEFRAIL